MAYLDISDKSGNYNVVITVNGIDTKFSTRTKDWDIANVVLAKIRKLEAAYINGLTMEECGLLDWVEKFRVQNPQVYSKLANLSLVPQVGDGPTSKTILLCPPKEDSHISKITTKLPRCEAAKNHVVRVVDGVVEVDYCYFTFYIENRDVVVYSRAKHQDMVYIYLTKETANSRGIGVDWQSSTKQGIVDISGERRNTAVVDVFGTQNQHSWREVSGMLRYFQGLKERIDINRRWEMFEAVFDKSDTIFPGKPLVRHVNLVNRKEN